LTISGKTTGAAAGMNIDLSCLGLGAENMSEAQDALLVYGDATVSNGVVLHSATNVFKNVVNGMDLTITGISSSPVTITSEKSSTEIKAALSSFVENYNKYKELLNAATSYDTNQNTGEILFNSYAARQFDREMSNVLLQRVYGITGINSLQSLGISIQQSSETLQTESDEEGVTTTTTAGLLIFDEEKFDAIYESNPDGVKEFFYKTQERTGDDGKTTTTPIGWAQKFVDAAESLTGDYGIVTRELQTLQSKIDYNDERLNFLQERLDVKRQMYLNKFNALETALAKMSSDLSTISSIKTSNTSSSS
jgi:flagellar hook-associated protein 2